jgi:hypothetical protein
MDKAAADGLGENLVGLIQALGLHDVQGQLPRRERPLRQRREAQSSLLAASEQMMHINIGREALGVAAGFEDGNGGANMLAKSARACPSRRSYFSTAPAISSRLERSVVTVRISAMPRM